MDPTNILLLAIFSAICLYGPFIISSNRRAIRTMNRLIQISNNNAANLEHYIRHDKGLSAKATEQETEKHLNNQSRIAAIKAQLQARSESILKPNNDKVDVKKTRETAPPPWDSEEFLPPNV